MVDPGNLRTIACAHNDDVTHRVITVSVSPTYNYSQKSLFYYYSYLEKRETYEGATYCKSKSGCATQVLVVASTHAALKELMDRFVMEEGKSGSDSICHATIETLGEQMKGHPRYLELREELLDAVCSERVL